MLLQFHTALHRLLRHREGFRRLKRMSRGLLETSTLISDGAFHLKR
jgi:hypothetical protein